VEKLGSERKEEKNYSQMQKKLRHKTDVSYSTSKSLAEMRGFFF